MITFGLLLLIWYSEAFHYGPSNTAVVKGNNFTMECGSNETVPKQWTFANRSKEVALTDGFVVASESELQINASVSGQYDLHISGSYALSSGNFYCLLEGKSLTDPGETDIRIYEAYLAVLDDDPQCETSASDSNNTVNVGDEIEFTCRVTYSHSSNDLRMQWRQADGTLIKARTTVKASDISTEVTSSFRIKATAELSESKFICLTYFVEGKESISSEPYFHKAINTPHYRHVCTISPPNVQYTEISAVFWNEHSLTISALVTIPVVISLLLLIIMFANRSVRSRTKEKGLKITTNVDCQGKREMTIPDYEMTPEYEFIKEQVEIQPEDQQEIYYNLPIEEDHYDKLSPDSIQQNSVYAHLRFQ